VYLNNRNPLRRRSFCVLTCFSSVDIHSPAGGMGMNLGLRDAIGFGRVMEEHFEAAKSSVDQSRRILEDYGAARHERAKTTIRLTKQIMGVAVLMRSENYYDIRYWAMRLIAKIPAFTGMAAWRISGLGNR